MTRYRSGRENVKMKRGYVKHHRLGIELLSAQNTEESEYHPLPPERHRTGETRGFEIQVVFQMKEREFRPQLGAHQGVGRYLREVVPPPLEGLLGLHSQPTP